MATPSDTRYPPVILAAQAVTNALRSIDVNLPFALCGEVASSIYRGLGAAPLLKLEVMILSPNMTLEPLQHAIVQTDPAHFSFCQSRDSAFLCFHDDDTRILTSHASQLHIPMILTVSQGHHPLHCISDIGGLPLVPYSFLILRKLEQWDIAFKHEEQEQSCRRSSVVISKEIREMLKLLHIRDLHKPQDPPFDALLHRSSQERILRILALHNAFTKEWRKLGFSTSVELADRPVSSQKLTKKKPRSKRKKPHGAGADVGDHSSVNTPKQNVTSASAVSHVHEGTISQPINIPSALIEPSSAPANLSVTGVKKSASAKEPRLSFTQIRHVAAQTTTRLLQELGFSCAIFGSFACKLYGNKRIPNDVDILVLTPPGNTQTQEDIKEAIVAADPDHFALKASRDPAATYRVLYFYLSVCASTAKHSSSKVDILLPGVMHLPVLPPSVIVWKNNVPLVPFSVLILHKLQGWDDHRNATEERYMKKAPADKKDLEWLIGERNVRNAALLRELMQSRPWSDRILFSEEFERLSRERVVRFCEAFPQHAKVFKNLGFATARGLESA